MVDSNDYYPFGMSFIRNEEEEAYFGTGSYKNYKFGGKELQETGMYDYGWRHYMPDIARWNGVDQLAEMYLSTSTYAYVANNPVLRFDVDGRWFNDDGTIDTSGRTPSYVSGKQYLHSFLGSNRNDGGGSYNFTGNAAGSMYNYFVNGGTIDRISFVNGEARWYTLDGIDSMYEAEGDMTEVLSADMTMHRAKLTGNDYYLDYWGLLNNASTAQSYATNGIGATLGNVARTSNNLVDAGKMIKTPNIFKTYNLYRSNGYLNGNKYISGRKFLNNVKGINALNNSKVVKGIGYAGLVISVEQFRVSHHPGYISRGITSFGAGFIPYVGPAISIGIDNTNVNYWNIWTWGDPE
ncbi:RHS repeat-associated core domain-containing protein [uncultured Chryseobacterium sp.]|uniref:RHS repeat-associated core domain-containing protein n=1 Tax=uncultured Chryseobacterium sp. TaxID=259322 RepID=UPI0026133E2B|nr:RHS repeat-associated core domain-containing protein [uncultured Chryseobacterium sp.]